MGGSGFAVCVEDVQRAPELAMVIRGGGGLLSYQIVSYRARASERSAMRERVDRARIFGGSSSG